jgi:hypothetical protein
VTTPAEELEEARVGMTPQHWGNCPAHPERVRDHGPCDPVKCGAEAQLAALEAAAINAYRASPEFLADAVEATREYRAGRVHELEEALRAVETALLNKHHDAAIGLVRHVLGTAGWEVAAPSPGGEE